jgi:hypothetical protein
LPEDALKKRRRQSNMRRSGDTCRCIEKFRKKMTTQSERLVKKGDHDLFYALPRHRSAGCKV